MAGRREHAVWSGSEITLSPQLALDQFLRIWTGSTVSEDIATQLTGDEAEALADLFLAYGNGQAAQSFAIQFAPDGSVVTQIVGPIHGGHATVAEHALDAVAGRAAVLELPILVHHRA